MIYKLVKSIIFIILKQNCQKCSMPSVSKNW